MNFDQYLTPYSLIFLASFLFGVISPQLKNRRKMMGVKCTGDIFGATYLYFMGGMAGACAGLIAATGALIQALTPHHYLKKTMWPRVILACILSAVSIMFIYKSPVDILPISMVVVCRFGELQAKAQRIRFVYWITTFPWMMYHYVNEFYLPLIACTFLSLSLFWSMWRHCKSVTSQDET